MLEKIKNGTDSFKELVVIYLVAATLVALLFALFEQRTLVDAYWWTFITGLTIGYGDIYPVTTGGQILTIIWAHFTVLIMIPLFIGRLIVTMIENKNEFTDSEQKSFASQLSQIVENTKKK